VIKLLSFPGELKDGEALAFVGPLWDSIERVKIVLNTALPEFRCPICRAENFTLIQDAEQQIWSPLAVRRSLDSHVVGIVPTLSMNCNDGGYIVKFSSEELQKRAERMK
jgi:hypothetical protein